MKFDNALKQLDLVNVPNAQFILQACTVLVAVKEDLEFCKFISQIQTKVEVCLNQPDCQSLRQYANHILQLVSDISNSYEEQKTDKIFHSLQKNVHPKFKKTWIDEVSGYFSLQSFAYLQIMKEKNCFEGAKSKFFKDFILSKNVEDAIQLDVINYLQNHFQIAPLLLNAHFSHLDDKNFEIQEDLMKKFSLPQLFLFAGEEEINKNIQTALSSKENYVQFMKQLMNTYNSLLEKQSLDGIKIEDYLNDKEFVQKIPLILKEYFRDPENFIANNTSS